LYLIDNSPVKTDIDSILTIYKNIHYYFTGENKGYGAGHNIALREAVDSGAEFHIVMNPDIRFSPDIIPVLASYMYLHDDVAYILPKVVYPDGSIQYLCKLLPTPFDLIFRRFVPNLKFVQKLNDKYVLRNNGYNQIINPPCLSGCFMFLRASAIKEHNLFFDERFFMYCEDFDLIRRIHCVGKTIYYPNVSIVHDHARESHKSNKMLFEHIKSAIKYFNKWGWFIDKERKYFNHNILRELGYISG
jgi:GT2 family glycosyltransferase